MKILVKLFIIFCFLTVPSYAHDILVLPADLLQTKENYYSFDEPSEIIANDIIKEFNKGYSTCDNLASNFKNKQTKKNCIRR